MIEILYVFERRISECSLYDRRELKNVANSELVCCCLHIKSRSDLYSVLSNIRTGPTDADAFRGHRLTWKRKEKKNQKNKAPDSQTSQATCQTKEIDRAHRSHLTREAKQNKTNKKNQGSPIKTLKSYDSFLVPLLGRGEFTAGFGVLFNTTAVLSLYFCVDMVFTVALQDSIIDTE